MHIETIYKNIDQELGKIFPKELVGVIGCYSFYKSERNPISVYDKVLSSVGTIEHDGIYGEVGALHYNLYILYKENGKKHVAFWKRKKQFNNSKENNLYYIQSTYTLKEFMDGDEEIGKVQFNRFYRSRKKIVMDDGFTLA